MSPHTSNPTHLSPPAPKRADRIRAAATAQAERSAQRFRHGAVVIKGGKILAGGHNLVKPGFAGPLSAATTATASGGDETATAHCPRQHGFSMHAEMTAISSALRGERMQGSKSSQQGAPSSRRSSAAESHSVNARLRGADIYVVRLQQDAASRAALRKGLYAVPAAATTMGQSEDANGEWKGAKVAQLLEEGDVFVTRSEVLAHAAARM
ncbi:hypothetical protein FA09DRAFT_340972 [Tilletiopsis washingtonensis]|uniref:Uncharacterized protein n=1 Tax=Tilletiopsis washingtonensis TaxID=58919 RepID=A0A316Z3K4_9BASI|nr:hypothetical protein FA09DRAFT_340972 [Tilletiopsis washingtonensis]PWN95654.1 hypothetical protein FA09DRAFT_340972 [Tilletiopsis washingtonensis]